MASQNNLGIRILLRIIGGNVIVSRKKQEILTKITNLTNQDLRTTLSRIHSLSSWKNEWIRSAENDITSAANSSDTQIAKIFYKKACAKFYLASLFSSGSDNITLLNKLKETYCSYGKLEAKKFEHISINYEGQLIWGYFQHPDPPRKVPVILIIPPLGAIKEQMDAITEFFLNHGMATLSIDVAGFGETTGKLTLNFEENCKAVISYLSQRNDILNDKIISMGISIGAYWTMKLASVDSRVKLAIGISTPAMYQEQWKKLPQHYWGYFQQYFGTNDLQSTKEIAEQMTLAGVMDKIACPVLLIHGNKDKISHPDAVAIFSKLVKSPLTIKVYPECGHGCFEELDDMLPFVLKWSWESMQESINV